MTLRDLLVIAGLCALTEDTHEATRLALQKEVVHLFGEDAFERLSAIEASDEESEVVMLQILRSLAVDQELLDVKAGIPARDAEIEALRKEIEALQAVQPRRLIFPTMLRKMWSGSEVQAWLDDELAKLTKSSSQQTADHDEVQL